MAEGEVFVLVEVVKVHDADGLANYQAGARAQLSELEGVVVGRGFEPVDGEQPFGGLLIQKWPSAKAFRDWQESEAYRPLKELRLKSVEMRIGIVPCV